MKLSNAQLAILDKIATDLTELIIEESPNYIPDDDLRNKLDVFFDLLADLVEEEGYKTHFTIEMLFKNSKLQ